MPIQGKKVVVVMPAHNAEETIIATYNALPHAYIDEVIIVDDASTDNTVAIARTLLARVIRHHKNKGYGGNQKTCYGEAQRRGADIVIMVHPDHQYDPSFIPIMIRGIIDEGYKAVFGSRMLNPGGAKAGGMPVWKRQANALLTSMGNRVLGTNYSELHSGFRAYDAHMLARIPIKENSDHFVFDTQIIIQLAARNIAVKEIPITTRYFPEASQVGVLVGMRYGLEILYNLFLYKTGLRKF